MARGLLAKGKRTCSVYLMETGYARIKIGRAYDPVTRRAGVQTGNSEKVELVHHWRLKVAEAVALETALLRIFRPVKVRGEWHDMEAPDIHAVGELWLAGRRDDAVALAAAIVASRQASEAWEKHSRTAHRGSSIWRRDCAVEHEAREAELWEAVHIADRAADALGRPTQKERWTNAKLDPKGQRSVIMPVLAPT